MKLYFGLLLVLLYGECNAVPRNYGQQPQYNNNQNSYNTPVALAFYGYELLELLDLSAPPRSLAIVDFPGSQKNYYLGDLVTAETNSIPPNVYLQCSPNTNYTLLFIDPNIPQQGYGGPRTQYLHWLVVNAYCGDYQQLVGGITLINYQLILPEYRYGRHLFTVLVYEQPSTLDNLCNEYNEKNYDRSSFSLDEFESDNNYGIPIAGNFGRVRYNGTLPGVM